MNTQARRKSIEEILRAEGFSSVNALAKLLNVSEVTIRNDLSTLEDEKKISRIHGGAMITSEHARAEIFEERSSVNQREKLWIARRAAELVNNYDSLILDASTTAFCMANYLKNHRGLTVITNGIEVAFRLAENHTNKVVLTGGLLRPESSSLTGQFGNGFLGGMHANKAFLSCSGWSPGFDLMDDDVFEAQLKREMVEVAESVILLVDASKFEKQGVASFAPLNCVNMVITDERVNPMYLAPLREANIQVNICSEHTTRVVEGGNGEKPIRIGFANQDTSASFQTLVRQGLITKATSANIDLVLADNHEDGPTALANAKYFVQEQFDLVVEFNTDVRYGNIIMECLRSANIPVIAIDIPMPGATFVGVDNYKAGLMGGHLAGTYVQQVWQGHIDKVIALELPSSGPVPAARIQGQIDGLRQYVQIAEEDIIRLDSKNMYTEAHKAVSTLLPTLKAAQHVVVLGINDEVIMGALVSFEEAGGSERVVAVGQGTDEAVRQEMARPGSRIIGSVTFFPEYYGDLIINLALQILQGKQVPPAVYTDHILVLPEQTINSLELAALPYEYISVHDYGKRKFSR